MLVVFDTETNGLNVETCDILSIGWIKAQITTPSSFRIIEHVEYFVRNENIHNNPLCLSINGITDEYRQQNGKPIDDILNIFSQSIQGLPVFAYNVNFDRDFICKYRPDFFETSNVSQLLDVRTEYQQTHDTALMCSLQKTIYETFNGFNYWVPIRYHLHTAYDDVYAELIVLLHQKYHIDISSYCEKLDEEQEPAIPTGHHTWKPLSQIRFNICDLINKNRPEFDYIEDWMISRY